MTVVVLRQPGSERGEAETNMFWQVGKGEQHVKFQHETLASGQVSDFWNGDAADPLFELAENQGRQEVDERLVGLVVEILELLATDQPLQRLGVGAVFEQ